MLPERYSVLVDEASGGQLLVFDTERFGGDRPRPVDSHDQLAVPERDASGLFRFVEFTVEEPGVPVVLYSEIQFM